MSLCHDVVVAFGAIVFYRRNKTWKIVSIGITFFTFGEVFGTKASNCCHWCIVAFGASTHLHTCKSISTIYYRKTRDVHSIDLLTYFFFFFFFFLFYRHYWEYSQRNHDQDYLKLFRSKLLFFLFFFLNFFFFFFFFFFIFTFTSLWYIQQTTNWWYFSYFSKKIDFDISCELCSKETIRLNVKTYFLEKRKKNVKKNQKVVCFFLPRVLSFKMPIY